MGMGSYGAYAETVTRDFVKAQCPKEYQEFMDILEKHGVEFDTFCNFLHHGQDDYILEELNLEDGAVTEIMDKYILLTGQFLTNTDLELEVSYHDAEDRGDELDGGSFSVDGVYQLTPAGEKFKDDIRRKWWTTFG
jgi:hypothetical protein